EGPARGSAVGAPAFPPPPPRGGRAAHPRSGRGGFPVHRHRDVRRHGERGAAHHRAMGDRAALPRAPGGVDRLLSPQLPRAADRLRAARHAHAVRSRAARLPRAAREADVILRMAAAVALIAGFGALAAYLHMMARLPTSSAAEKHLRRMKDRVAQPAAAAPTSYDAIAALPKSRPLPEYAPLERAAVSLEGYVQSVVRASDDDLHLELVPVPR